MRLELTFYNTAFDAGLNGQTGLLRYINLKTGVRLGAFVQGKGVRVDVSLRELNLRMPR